MNRIEQEKLFARFDGAEPMLSPREVARLFSVDPKTVIRWVKAGRMLAVKTPMGHHRFKVSEVKRLLTEWQVENYDPEILLEHETPAA